MSSCGQSAEISYCASLLAKSFKDHESGKTSFGDVHDALGKFLSSSQLSKVEELARKYTDLPVHVLDGKIKWLESHGEKPARLEECLKEVAASKLCSAIKNGVNHSVTSSHKKQSPVPTVTNEPNNNSIYDSKSSSTKSSSGILKLRSTKPALKSTTVDNGTLRQDSCSEPSVVTHINVSKILGSLNSDEQGPFSEKVKSGSPVQFIEMKEISLQEKKIDPTESSNMGKVFCDVNSSDKTEIATTKKKKNKKKKKKSKSPTQMSAELTEPVTMEESATSVEDINSTASKSTRNARRKKLSKLRKGNENPINSDEIKTNEKDNIDGDCFERPVEKTAVKAKDKMKKRGKNDSKQKPVSRNNKSNDESSTIGSEEVVKKRKSGMQSDDNLKLGIESILRLSMKKDSQRKSGQSNVDTERTFKPPPWHVVGSRKSNIGTVSSNGFSKTPMTCPSKTTLMLDSAGGSIASSSEDNSSTSSNGTMEHGAEASASIQTPNVFSPTEENNQICPHNEEKDNDETSHIYRNFNIMHFGNRWDLTDHQSTSEQDILGLQQTDIENLLHNELGLDFFNNHVDEQNMVNIEECPNGANKDNSDAINFECVSNSVPVSESDSNFTTGAIDVTEDSRDNVIIENVSPPVNNNRQGQFLKERSTFDYDAAVQFLWKEWNRVPDKTILKE